MQIPNLTEMLEAGLHFGHKTSKWHPKMEPFIFTERNGVHIINLEETRKAILAAMDFLTNSAANGAVILFVGTKSQARAVVEEAAKSCGMPYVSQGWIGGLITNFSEIKRSIKKYHTLKKEKEEGVWTTNYVKKEQVKRQKELEKLQTSLNGIDTLEKIPDVLFVFDMRGDKTACKEAQRANVKIVGVCDTNVNPEAADFVIPANDDAVKSISMIAGLAAVAVNEGRKEFVRKQAEKGAALEKAKADARALRTKDAKPEVVAQG